MGVKSVAAVNGRAMWDELRKIADYAESVGKPTTDFINLVLTDIEMPEMDGYIPVSYTHLDVYKRQSSYTEAGSEVTLRALELGAVDFSGKPKADNEKSM